MRFTAFDPSYFINQILNDASPSHFDAKVISDPSGEKLGFLLSWPEANDAVRLVKSDPELLIVQMFIEAGATVPIVINDVNTILVPSGETRGSPLSKPSEAD